MRAVRFDRYGGVDELYITDVPIPEPSADEVVVRVRTATANTGEAKIREGQLDAIWPAHFPEGEGSEFSGVVHAVGPDVTDLAPGDAVLGMTDDRSAQADYTKTGRGRVHRKPDAIDWDTAAAIPIAGRTAAAVIDAVQPTRGETLVVAGAAGGVGVLLTQLAVDAGARVIGVAGANNAEFLRGLGAVPVNYDGDIAAQIREAAPDGIDAFADCHGGGYVDLAVKLGVPVERIDTIADFAAAGRTGAKTDGGSQLKDASQRLEELVGMVASGALRIPIKARYDLDQVKDAYRRLTGSGVGKVVITVSTDD